MAFPDICCKHLERPFGQCRRSGAEAIQNRVRAARVHVVPSFPPPRPYVYEARWVDIRHASLRPGRRYGASACIYDLAHSSIKPNPQLRAAANGAKEFKVVGSKLATRSLKHSRLWGRANMFVRYASDSCTRVFEMLIVGIFLLPILQISGATIATSSTIASTSMTEPFHPLGECHRYISRFQHCQACRVRG
jgi:hypothetical protein